MKILKDVRFSEIFVVEISILRISYSSSSTEKILVTLREKMENELRCDFFTLTMISWITKIQVMKCGEYNNIHKKILREQLQLVWGMGIVRRKESKKGLSVIK